MNHLHRYQSESYQRLKKQGIGTVVGLDFSQNSLEYTGQQAEQANLNIEYHLGNYLDYHDSRQFDLITLVMTFAP